MWRRLPMSVLAAMLAALPAYGAARYNCAADDANVKLSIDVAFADKGARNLSHFRGALIAKPSGVPAGFAQLMLDSSQLVHSWAYGDELRLDIYGEGQDAEAGSSFDLIVIAGRDAPNAPLPGTYLLTYGGQKNAAAPQLKGTLTCFAK